MDAIVLKSRELRKCFPKRQRKAAKHFRDSVLAVPITFNKFQNSCELEFDLMPSARMGLRMVHQFFGPDFPSFDNFLYYLKQAGVQLEAVDMKMAGKLMLRYEQTLPKPKTMLLILVDELMVGACEHVDNAVQLLQCIGHFLDHPEFDSDVIVSSLDPTVFAKYTCGSQRQWNWLPLTPLVAAESLFKRVRHSMTEPVRSAIAECCGHPRTLQNLHYRVNKATEPPSFGDLIDYLVSMAQMRPNFAMVKPAVLGQLVNLDDCPDGSNNTYLQLAMNSMYLNTIEPDQTEFIPKMSTILMRKFAGQIYTRESDPLEAKFAGVLNKLLDMSLQMPPASFESFHAHFELCRQTLLQDQVTSVKDNYKDAMSWSTEDLGALKLQISGSSIVRSESFFPTVPNVLNECGVVRTYPHSNPGFDASVLYNCYRHSSTEGSGQDLRKLALFFETRYSANDSTTKLTAEEVIEKTCLTMEAFHGALKAGNVVEPSNVDVCLVVVAYRNVSEGLREQLKHFYEKLLIHRLKREVEKAAVQVKHATQQGEKAKEELETLEIQLKNALYALEMAQKLEKARMQMDATHPLEHNEEFTKVQAQCQKAREALNTLVTQHETVTKDLAVAVQVQDLPPLQNRSARSLSVMVMGRDQLQNLYGSFRFRADYLASSRSPPASIQAIGLTSRSGRSLSTATRIGPAVRLLPVAAIRCKTPPSGLPRQPNIFGTLVRNCVRWL
eukprot:GILK01009781.1.p1 GENE.GILK01009781.1~~GILK01009781.1.p1  ORF type:complete len:829 (+),score=113.02 GILK01009781.1:316-2487(+)